MQTAARYCRFCGSTLGPLSASDGRTACVTSGCVNFGRIEWDSPAVLVQTFIFAQSHLLLMKRGTEPYEGKWAPPGGFVESYESPEDAAVRETREELEIVLDPAALIPLGIVSIARLNQVYLSFLARLDRKIPPRPRAPEALEGDWFPKSAFPLTEIWAPFSQFDLGLLFERADSGRFEFFQRSDRFLRVISGHDEIRYLWEFDNPQ